MVILNQNHTEIDVAELILVSIKVINALPRGFPDNDDMTIWPPWFDSWGEIAIFELWGGFFPSKFDIVIPKTFSMKI